MHIDHTVLHWNNSVGTWWRRHWDGSRLQLQAPRISLIDGAVHHLASTNYLAFNACAAWVQLLLSAFDALLHTCPLSTRHINTFKNPLQRNIGVLINCNVGEWKSVACDFLCFIVNSQMLHTVIVSYLRSNGKPKKEDGKRKHMKTLFRVPFCRWL